MLTKTQLKILACLIDSQNKLFGIRELAREISTVYYLVQRNIHQLEDKGVITIQRAGKTHIVTLHTQAEPSYLIEAENFKRDSFYMKYPDIRVTLKKIIGQAESAFFILLVFGSYAKKPGKDSDLDLLFIVPATKQIKIMENAVSSAARTSTTKIHEIIVTEKSFVSMLQKKELNVAREAKEKHIQIYGNENYYNLIR